MSVLLGAPSSAMFEELLRVAPELRWYHGARPGEVRRIRPNDRPAVWHGDVLSSGPEPVRVEREIEAPTLLAVLPLLRLTGADEQQAAPAEMPA